MSDFDLDRLGDVWRQEPDPSELLSLQRSAAAVQRRARWRRLIDIVVAITVAVVVMFLVWQNPKKETFTVGACAMLILLYGHHRQRRLREEEMRSLTGSAKDMIDQSIGRIEATVRYHRLSLFGIGPAFLVALLFSALADRGGAVFAGLREMPWFRVFWIGTWLATVALVVIYVILAIRKGRAELARLNAMRDAYRKEEEISRS